MPDCIGICTKHEWWKTNRHQHEPIANDKFTCALFRSMAAASLLIFAALAILLWFFLLDFFWSAVMKSKRWLSRVCFACLEGATPNVASSSASSAIFKGLNLLFNIKKNHVTRTTVNTRTKEGTTRWTNVGTRRQVKPVNWYALFTVSHEERTSLGSREINVYNAIYYWRTFFCKNKTNVVHRNRAQEQVTNTLVQYVQLRWKLTGSCRRIHFFGIHPKNWQSHLWPSSGRVETSYHGKACYTYTTPTLSYLRLYDTSKLFSNFF